MQSPGQFCQFQGFESDKIIIRMEDDMFFLFALHQIQFYIITVLNNNIK